VGDSLYEVYALYVDPAMLGEGIGWALWQQVERDARDGGKSAIELWVLQGNRLGIGWYDRQGGSVVGQRDVELADGGHTELRYRFDLKQVSHLWLAGSCQVGGARQSGKTM
jgi:ribosomal protein S18 acetylase RimI-like enzyme